MVNSLTALDASPNLPAALTFGMNQYDSFPAVKPELFRLETFNRDFIPLLLPSFISFIPSFIIILFSSNTGITSAVVAIATKSKS